MAVLGIGESSQFSFLFTTCIKNRKKDCTVYALKVPLTHHPATSKFYITYKDGINYTSILSSTPGQTCTWDTEFPHNWTKITTEKCTHCTDWCLLTQPGTCAEAPTAVPAARFLPRAQSGALRPSRPGTGCLAGRKLSHHLDQAKRTIWERQRLLRWYHSP